MLQVYRLSFWGLQVICAKKMVPLHKTKSALFGNNSFKSWQCFSDRRKSADSQVVARSGVNKSRGKWLVSVHNVQQSVTHEANYIPT